MEIDTPEESKDIANKITPKEMQVPKIDKIDKNEEISISYVFMGKRLNQKGTIVDTTVVYTITLNIMNDNKDHELTSVDECRYRYDWPKWKDAIQ